MHEHNRSDICIYVHVRMYQEHMYMYISHIICIHTFVYIHIYVLRYACTYPCVCTCTYSVRTCTCKLDSCVHTGHKPCTNWLMFGYSCTGTDCRQVSSGRGEYCGPQAHWRGSLGRAHHPRTPGLSQYQVCGDNALGGLCVHVKTCVRIRESVYTLSGWCRRATVVS